MDTKDEQIIALKRELYATKLLQALGIAIQTGQDIKPIVERFADNCARVEYERDLYQDHTRANKFIVDLLFEGFRDESAPEFAPYLPSMRPVLVEQVNRGRVGIVVYRYLGDGNAQIRNLYADYPGSDGAFETTLSEIAALLFGAPLESDITRSFPGIDPDAFREALRKLAFCRHWLPAQYETERNNVFDAFWPNIEKTGRFKQTPGENGKPSISARKNAKKAFKDNLEAIFKNAEQHMKSKR